MTFRVNKALRQPATANLLTWFEFNHLPTHLREIAEPMADAAHRLTHKLCDGPELSAGLRHLLEAKDCFVRQALADHEPAADE